MGESEVLKNRKTPTKNQQDECVRRSLMRFD
jgi:hypothetical protein